MYIVVSVIAVVAGLLYAGMQVVLAAPMWAQIMVVVVGVLVIVSVLAEPMSGTGTLISMVVRHPVKLARRYRARRRSAGG